MTDRLEAAVAELVAALREDAAPARTDNAPPVLLDIPAAAARLGIGRSLLYSLIASGQLRSLKVGRRRLVPSDAVADLARRGQP